MLRTGHETRTFGVVDRHAAAIIARMKMSSSDPGHPSDFGPTVPGQRSGEGSGSILPYLANSLQVNPNAGALSLAREMRAAAQRKKNPTAPGTDAKAAPISPLRPKPSHKP
jgi:hypothetical protein